MAYEKVNWLNKGETGAKYINKTNLNQMDSGIYNLDLNKVEVIQLLTVGDTAPAECERGDKYYNTTNELIYTATTTDTWGTEGEVPLSTRLYVDLSSSKLYYYDGVNFNSYGGGGGDTLPIGIILPFSDDTIPEGYMICDGSAISRTTYSTLFSVIGTTYGVGDGSTTFNLPNLKGRIPVGYDSTDSDFDTLGETGGEKTHTLTVNEMPSHAHSYTYSTSVSDWSSRIPLGSNAGVGTSGAGISTTGGDQAHNNLQPYIVINYIIKVSQTTSTQAQVVDGYSTSTTDSYSCNYVNSIKDIYSTDEVKTNKVWIDGKPIYRKCFNRGSDTTTFNHNISNVDLIWIDTTHSIRKHDSGNVFNIIGGSNDASIRLAVYVNSTQVVINKVDNTSPTYIYIVLEYTKTTD